MTYDDLKAQIQKLVSEGKIGIKPDDLQRVDFAYGNTKIENEDITREIVERVTTD